MKLAVAMATIKAILWLTVAGVIGYMGGALLGPWGVFVSIPIGFMIGRFAGRTLAQDIDAAVHQDIYGRELHLYETPDHQRQGVRDPLQEESQDSPGEA